MLKLTVVGEVANWGRRHATKNFLTATGNLVFAWDFPDAWWNRRSHQSIGEWWKLANMPHEQFKQEWSD